MMVKKILIALAIIAVIILTVIFLYRQAIIQYSVEKMVRDNIPPYIKFENIRFDLAKNSVFLNNLKILNPPDYSSQYLLEIKSVSCRYAVTGGFIPHGLVISGIMIKDADITVERTGDGRVNMVEMGKFIEGPALKPTDISKQENNSQQKKEASAGMKLSDIIKLPQSITIKNAKIAFLDRQPYDKAHLISIEDVNGEVSMTLDDTYSKILDTAFTLEGNLNGDRSETIKWVASLNPTTSQLTMSNRLNVSNLDILAFAPYYDKYSPFVFKRGRFSGELVFDFDKGNIGSTNVITLSNIMFWVKPGYENAEMWGSTVPEVMRYFTTTSGDIVFDFKIKGSISSPEFYLGPISKRAITSMAIDKISQYAIEAVTKKPGEAAQQNLGKAQEYIELFKGLIKKK